MFYGEFDVESRILRYVNAGHSPPIFVSEMGEVTTLLGGDLPVGMLPDAAFQERRVTLSKGWVIVVHTDEVTDAQNSHRGEGPETGHCRRLC